MSTKRSKKWLNQGDFDVVCSLEVLEHVENLYRSYRLAKAAYVLMEALLIDPKSVKVVSVRNFGR